MIFFDFDDTLHDFAATYRAAVRSSHRVAAADLAGLSEDAWARALEEGWFALWPDYEAGRIDEEDLRWGRLRIALEHVGIAPKNDLVRAVHDAFHEGVRSGLRLYPDVLPVLRRLRGSVPLGLLTNGPARQQRERIRLAGLEAFFDAVVISGEVGAFKPDPEIFAHARRLASGAGAAGEGDIIMVGDHPEADVVGARSAGWTGVWINRRGETWPDELPGPDHQVRDLHELLDWLASRRRVS